MTPIKKEKMKKSERLNHELIFLSEHPFFQLKDLMAEFQISKRTALRDMAALEDMGLAFYTETGKNGGYHLVSQTLLTPIYFTQDDLTMIFYALNSLRRLSVTPFDKSYPQIFEKLLVSLSTAQREYVLKILNVLEFYDVPVISSSTFLRELLEATVDEQILYIDYKQTERLQQLIQVYKVFYRSGIWFFEAYLVDEDKWKTYRVDCLLACERAENQENRQNRAQLAKSFMAFYQDYLTISFKCEIDGAGKEHFLKGAYRDMQLHEENGQYYIVGHFSREELDYMVQYLITFGKHLTVMEPDFLREAYLAELQEIVDRYAQ
ncbi:unnamed protein product [Streptococcus gallolyticus subsp. gallolyticus ATCC BAA-2069]|nr:unnamed protein product [Streptococcus gallolyticus subsp. gallolyticus ATCC BAA-2069]